MVKANGEVLATPGVGESVAFHDVSSKGHQVVMLADVDGHIIGSRNEYVINIPSQVHVAVASTVHWDLFNADAALVVRVKSILHIPDMVTAVATGIGFAWLLERTTSAGTGGTTLVPWLPDLNQGALDADITARSKPTGAAAQSTDLRTHFSHGEETNVANNIPAALGGIELIPDPVLPSNGGAGIVLRQNQGIRQVQVTNSALGNSAWCIVFSVE